MSKNIFLNVKYSVLRHVKILRAVCRSRVAPLPPSCRVEEKVIIMIMTSWPYFRVKLRKK